MTRRRLVLIGILVAALIGGGVVTADYLSLAGPAEGPGSIGHDPGPQVTIQGSTTINLSKPPDSTQVELRTADGNATFTSSDNTQVAIHVDQLTGSWTNVTQIDATAADLTIDAEGMDPYTVGGQITSASVRDSFGVDDATVDFVYEGPDSTTSKLTIQGVPSSTTIAAVDASTNDVLDTATSDASGSITFSSLDNSQHSVLLQTNDGGPSVDNSSASPQGGETIRWSNETLAIGVSDPDLPDDNLTVEYFVDSSSVGTESISSNGTVQHSVSGLSEGSHTWSVEVTDAFGETQTSDTFSFVVDHHDPVVTDARPTGGQSNEPTQLEVDVEDADFPKDGDTLSVDFQLDGSSVGSDTLSGNGTATTSIPSPDGGQHNWSVTITDSYGQTVTEEYSFSVPDKLRIYKETQPTDLVDNVTVELEFFYETGGDFRTFSRNTSDGTLNLTGLPVGRPFVVVADADGYIPRRIFVDSIYQQQSVYMLNESKQIVDVVFQIQDYSGDYPQDTTVLQVERSLNGSRQVVVGDFFGANAEFPAQLKYNERHWLVLKNTETGETNEIGTYTPLATEQQEVTVSPEGDITIRSIPAITSINPATNLIPARSGIPLNMSVRPGRNTTFASWNVSVYFINETAGINNTLYQYNSTVDDGGRVSPTLDLSNRSNGSLKIVQRWKTTEGNTGRNIVTKAVQKTYGQQWSLLSALAALVGLIAPGNQEIFAGTLAIALSILGTAGVASAVRMPTEMIGAVALIFLTAFAIIGWLEYTIVFVGVVAWASITFLRRRY